MKKFKNTFAILGSQSQTESFIEYLKIVGYTEFKGNPKWPNLYICKGVVTYISTVADDDIYYNLPAQWQDAMDAASEVEEVRFEKGSKFIGQAETIVLCTGARCGYFSGVVIKGNGLTKTGEYKDNWDKNTFNPYTEPITL